MITDIMCMLDVLLLKMQMDSRREDRLKLEAVKRIYNMAVQACGFTYADYETTKLLNREGKPLTPEDNAELDAMLEIVKAEHDRLIVEAKQKARDAKLAEEAAAEEKRKIANDLAAAPWREARIKRKLEAAQKQNVKRKKSP